MRGTGKFCAEYMPSSVNLCGRLWVPSEAFKFEPPNSNNACVSNGRTNCRRGDSTGGSLQGIAYYLSIYVYIYISNG